jgi:hypothetical protein
MMNLEYEEHGGLKNDVSDDRVCAIKDRIFL